MQQEKELLGTLRKAKPENKGGHEGAKMEKFGKFNKYAAARKAQKEGGWKSKTAKLTDEEKLLRDALRPKFGKALSKSAIDGDKAVATELTAEQKGEDLVIATDKIRMQFGENLEMVITRPDGTPLVRTHRQGRSVCREVSEQMKQILESEGHDTSNLGAHDYPVQMMFDLDEGTQGGTG